jgi:hypothetical protein
MRLLEKVTFQPGEHTYVVMAVVMAIKSPSKANKVLDAHQLH